MTDTPEVITDLNLHFDNPVYFSLDATPYDYPDVLVACLLDQPSMAPQEDELGNIQSGVRLDLVTGMYWVSAREGTSQSDIDNALAAYETKKAEMYPDA